MPLTPWSERLNDIRLKNKAAATKSRTVAAAGQVKGTHPSHAIDDYLGEYEHPAYGVLTIARGDTGITFDMHGIKMPLTHFHYDRFDTPDDEEDGKASVNFLTSPQGEIDRAEMSLDEAAIVFNRRVPAALTSAATLKQYLGTYETASGGKFDVVLRPDNTLALQYANGTFQNLIPWQANRFRIKEFPDIVFTFTVVNGRATELRQADPSAEFRFVRK